MCVCWCWCVSVLSQIVPGDRTASKNRYFGIRRAVYGLFGLIKRREDCEQPRRHIRPGPVRLVENVKSGRGRSGSVRKWPKYHQLLAVRALKTI